MDDWLTDTLRASDLLWDHGDVGKRHSSTGLGSFVRPNTTVLQYYSSSISWPLNALQAETPWRERFLLPSL